MTATRLGYTDKQLACDFSSQSSEDILLKVTSLICYSHANKNNQLTLITSPAQSGSTVTPGGKMDATVL